ncbi:hypothetical protein CRYUN_Cryun03dG0085800 [Craigia yunnanensis]
MIEELKVKWEEIETGERRDGLGDVAVVNGIVEVVENFGPKLLRERTGERTDDPLSVLHFGPACYWNPPAMQVCNLLAVGSLFRIVIQEGASRDLRREPDKPLLGHFSLLVPDHLPSNTSMHLILLNTGEILQDSKTLADQKVENDAAVALTLRKDDNEFEDVNIVQPNDFYQSRDADSGNW